MLGELYTFVYWQNRPTFGTCWVLISYPVCIFTQTYKLYVLCLEILLPFSYLLFLGWHKNLIWAIF